MTSGNPQVVDTRALATEARDLGAQWSLSGERELEANLVHIPSAEAIAEHLGSVDVVVVVVAGAGTVCIGTGLYEVQAGVLLFVPRGSPRSFSAGGSGLTYLTVHRRRDEVLAMGPTRTRPVPEAGLPDPGLPGPG